MPFPFLWGILDWQKLFGDVGWHHSLSQRFEGRGGCDGPLPPSRQPFLASHRRFVPRGERMLFLKGKQGSHALWLGLSNLLIAQLWGFLRGKTKAATSELLLCFSADLVTDVALTGVWKQNLQLANIRFPSHLFESHYPEVISIIWFCSKKGLMDKLQGVRREPACTMLSSCCLSMGFSICKRLCAGDWEGLPRYGHWRASLRVNCRGAIITRDLVFYFEGSPHHFSRFLWLWSFNKTCNHGSYFPRKVTNRLCIPSYHIFPTPSIHKHTPFYTHVLTSTYSHPQTHKYTHTVVHPYTHTSSLIILTHTFTC